jgi:hypothetical protein
MPYRDALRLADAGDAGDIGTFVTAAADWKVGDRFFDSDRRNWRIVEIYPNADWQPGQVNAVFVVEPA